MIELVKEGCCTIVIGRMRGADKSSCHAWIECDQIPYEPQTGLCVTYVSGQENGYQPWFRYNGEKIEVVHKAGREYEKFNDGFVGTWEDSTCGFSILPDTTVRFNWSKYRDVNAFRVTRETFNADGTFGFTFTFPKDEANPDGCAHWQLSSDGYVTVHFDRSLQGYGKQMSMRMKKRALPRNYGWRAWYPLKIMLAECYVGKWQDDTRGFSISQDSRVTFDWSKARDVNVLRVPEPGKITKDGAFTFTLLFPPDASNPSGCAHWRLHPDGRAIAFLDFKRSDGTKACESKMERTSS